MAISKIKIKYPNRLWRARKQLGLGQKQVRLLLGYQSQGLLSEYEHGIKLPTLEAALILEIIYGIPIRAMYPVLVSELENQIMEKILKNAAAYKNLVMEPGELKEYCTYAKVLDEQHSSQDKKDKLRRHITTTMRKLSYL